MKNYTNNQKLIVIGLVAFLIMFLLYHLKFSSYAQCVDGFVKSRDHMYRDLKNPKNMIENITNRAKVVCKVNPR